MTEILPGLLSVAQPPKAPPSKNHQPPPDSPTDAASASAASGAAAAAAASVADTTDDTDAADAVHKPLAFIRSQRGAPLLVNAGFVYRCERKSATRTYWLCVGYKRFKCNARIICEGNRHVKRTMHYSHIPETDRIEKAAQLEYHHLDGDDRDAFLNSVHK